MKLFKNLTILLSRGFTIAILAIFRILILKFINFFFKKNLFLTKIYNFKMFLDYNDRGLSRSLLLFRLRELDHKFLLEKIVQKNSKIFDIGANIGYYSLIEKTLINNSSNILCIEPIKKNINLLLKNLKINDSKAQVLHGGVSNEDGKKNIYVAHHSNLSSFHKNDNKHDIYTNNFETVNIFSIPKLISKFYVPDVIRMDVEGHEVEIFESLCTYLLQNENSIIVYPSIIFETHFWRYQEDDRFDKVLSDLFDYGYSAKYIASSDIIGANKIENKGYKSDVIIKTDGVERKIYDNISSDDLKYFLLEVGGVRTVVLQNDKVFK